MNQIPKISFYQDKESCSHNFNTVGYHLEYDLLSKEECESMILSSKKLNSYTSGKFSPVMMPHREIPDFENYLKNKKVVEIMSFLLRGPISALQSQFFYSPPGTIGFAKHQDNYFVRGDEKFASAWLALTDTFPENGGLSIFPGTNNESILPVQETKINSVCNQDPNAYRVETVVPPKYEQEHLSIPAGAVLFIHGNLVHASNDNITEDRWRHVLLNTYLIKGAPFRPGRDAKRAEFCVDS